LTGFAAGFRFGAGLRLLEELLDFEDEDELRDERERLVAIPESESISGGEKHISHSIAPATAASGCDSLEQRVLSGPGTRETIASARRSRPAMIGVPQDD
jgi:hypothetical protein